MENQEGEKGDSIGVGRHRRLSEAVYYDHAHQWWLSPVVKGKFMHLYTSK